MTASNKVTNPALAGVANTNTVNRTLARFWKIKSYTPLELSLLCKFCLGNFEGKIVFIIHTFLWHLLLFNFHELNNLLSWCDSYLPFSMLLMLLLGQQEGLLICRTLSFTFPK